MVGRVAGFVEIVDLSLMMMAKDLVGWMDHFMIGPLAWGGRVCRSLPLDPRQHLFGQSHSVWHRGLAWHDGDDHADAGGRLLWRRHWHHGATDGAGAAHYLWGGNGNGVPHAGGPETRLPLRVAPNGWGRRLTDPVF